MTSEAARYAVVAPVLACVVALGCGAAGPSLDPDEAEDDLELSGVEELRYGSFLSYEHVIRADLFRARGDLEEAAGELKQALVNDPDDFYLRAKYASVLTELGRYEEARRQLRRAIAGEPTAEYAWIALAELHLAEGQHEQAEDAARRAIRVEPRRHDAALWLAVRLRERGEHERAAEIYGRVIESDPDNAAAHLGLGEVSLELGNIEAAQEHLARYLDLDRTEPAVVAELAEAHFEGGEAGRAIELLELAVSLEPRNAELRERLVGLLVDERLYRRAIRHVRTLPPVVGDEEQVLVRRSCWLARSGRPYLARELIVGAYGHAPAAARVRLTLADIELQLGRLEVARSLLDMSCDDCGVRERAQRRELVEQVA
ncbi:MAG: tetratricopeptide repeat protein, partial [Deltaproteobacteria bacterium]|nr:tetratricopeptide repeat protein [Deltaproteobacteria bacterium]